MDSHNSTSLDNYRVAIDTLLRAFLPVFPQKDRVFIRSKLVSFLATTIAEQESPICRACEDLKKCLSTVDGGNATVYVCSMLDSICEEARQKRETANIQVLVSGCDYCELYKEMYGSQLEPLSEEEIAFSVSDLLKQRSGSLTRNDSGKDKTDGGRPVLMTTSDSQELPQKQSVLVKTDDKQEQKPSSFVNPFVQKNTTLVLLILITFIVAFCWSIAQDVPISTRAFFPRFWLQITTLMDYPRLLFLMLVQSAGSLFLLWGLSLIFWLVWHKRDSLRAKRLTAYVAIAHIALFSGAIYNKVRSIENLVGSEGPTSSYSQSLDKPNAPAPELVTSEQPRPGKQFLEQLAKYCPDWEKQNVDKGFLDWLAKDQHFWQKKVDKAVLDNNAREVADIFKKYKKENRFFTQLTSQIVGWENQNVDKRFVKWLDENDVLKKRIDSKIYPQVAITAGCTTCGRAQLKKAFENYDANQVVYIFKEYQKEKKFFAQMSEFLPDWKKQNANMDFLRWLSSNPYWYKIFSEAINNYDAKKVSDVFKFYRKEKKIIAHLNKTIPEWKTIDASKGFEKWLMENNAFWSKQIGFAFLDGNEKKVEFIFKKYKEENCAF